MQTAQAPASLTSCQANTSSLPLDAPFVPTTNRAAEERPLLFSHIGRLDADDKQPSGRFDGLYTWWMSSGCSALRVEQGKLPTVGQYSEINYRVGRLLKMVIPRGAMRAAETSIGFFIDASEQKPVEDRLIARREHHEGFPHHMPSGNTKIHPLIAGRGPFVFDGSVSHSNDLRKQSPGDLHRREAFGTVHLDVIGSPTLDVGKKLWPRILTAIKNQNKGRPSCTNCVSAGQQVRLIELITISLQAAHINWIRPSYCNIRKQSTEHLKSEFSLRVLISRLPQLVPFPESRIFNIHRLLSLRINNPPFEFHLRHTNIYEIL